MTTDNRTNEPTEAQGVAATVALARSIHGSGADHEDFDYYRKHVDAALVAAQGAAPQVIVCDYCGDALPSVASRAHIPTTPSIQRLGFSADKVVCPECVQRARGAAPVLPPSGAPQAEVLPETGNELRDEDGDLISSGKHLRVLHQGGYVCDTCVNILGINVRWDRADRMEGHPVLPSSDVDEDKLAEVEAERDAALELMNQHKCGENVEAAYRRAVDAEARIAEAAKLHRPVEIEPSSTICGHCSFQLPNGRYFGKIIEWPCPTAVALGLNEGENDD